MTRNELKNVSLRLDANTRERAQNLILPMIQSPRYALGMKPKRAAVLRLAILIGLAALESELEEYIDNENGS